MKMPFAFVQSLNNAKQIAFTYLEYISIFTFYDFAVGFEPNATMDVAHHMLLFGCTEPGQQSEVFNCHERANPCAQGSQIIYAWARDAPKLDLPKGVAFKVGGNTGIQYLVLQVHYADVSTFVKGNQIRLKFASCITFSNH